MNPRIRLIVLLSTCAFGVTTIWENIYNSSFATKYLNQSITTNQFTNKSKLPEKVGKQIPEKSDGNNLNYSQQIQQNIVTGWASFYGPGFHGNLTANGEKFNKHELTAAHRTLPFGTLVRVTNTINSMSVIVRINDRGPYIKNRIIDLSAEAGKILKMTNSGITIVNLEVISAMD
jgi:rare lipoprotein A